MSTVALSGEVNRDMAEIHFLVEEAPEDGYLARAVGSDIFTEADDVAELHSQVRDAERCHFDASEMPKVIRLHLRKDYANQKDTL